MVLFTSFPSSFAGTGCCCKASTAAASANRCRLTTCAIIQGFGPLRRRSRFVCPAHFDRDLTPQDPLTLQFRTSLNPAPRRGSAASAGSREGGPKAPAAASPKEKEAKEGKEGNGKEAKARKGSQGLQHVCSKIEPRKSVGCRVTAGSWFGWTRAWALGRRWLKTGRS